MKDLLLVIPSRSRPWNIERLLSAMEDTCRGDTSLVVGLDDDDPLRDMYPPGPEYEVRAGMHQVVAWLNELAVPRTSDYRYIGHIGDDNVPRTAGWDVALMQALQATPFAYGNDLYPHAVGTLCCHLFCRSEAIKALGFLGPPALRHMFVDIVWMAWGRAVGITYLPHVVLEHMHYSIGKSPLDLTYAAADATMAEGQAAFTAYCQDPAGLVADVERLRSVFP